MVDQAKKSASVTWNYCQECISEWERGQSFSNVENVHQKSHKTSGLSFSIVVLSPATHPYVCKVDFCGCVFPNFRSRNYHSENACILLETHGIRCTCQWCIILVTLKKQVQTRSKISIAIPPFDQSFSPKKNVIDQVGESLINDELKARFNALQILGDGDCLPRSFAKAICGDE